MGMAGLKELFRIGLGPSSSHSLAPRRAALEYRERFPQGPYKVILYGALAATGKGHRTLQSIEDILGTVEWSLRPDIILKEHPNGMDFFSISQGESSLWRVFSIGGGALSSDPKVSDVYNEDSMKEILQWSESQGKPIWQLVKEQEEDIWIYLEEVWTVMKESIKAGLQKEGVIPGGLNLQRKAANIQDRARQLATTRKRTALLSAYALAVSEENACGSRVVTAPTCGASGVLPGLLYFLEESLALGQEKILQALATAGLVGNLIKHKGSISGAAVGCQGEIGAACAMAAAGAAQLLGGSSSQIEYAAEMGLEHHLGLTCDPVRGLVQIPCIERNAMAAIRALDCAEYALLSDGKHRISFDQVVNTMAETGHDLPSLYKETALGGLALTYFDR